MRPPKDWIRPPGRPRRTWLRIIESDLQPLNFTSSPAGEVFMIVMRGGILWRRLHSSKRLALDDDDNDDDDDEWLKLWFKYSQLSSCPKSATSQALGEVSLQHRQTTPEGFSLTQCAQPSVSSRSD